MPVPPHPEEGASPCAFPKRKHHLAPVSKDGAASWFETPPHEAAELRQAQDRGSSP
jgi:hypothetical protein